MTINDVVVKFPDEDQIPNTHGVDSAGAYTGTERRVRELAAGPRWFPRQRFPEAVVPRGIGLSPAMLSKSLGRPRLEGHS